MMSVRVETSRFGTLELEEARFIDFPWGIPGFEQIKRFVLLEHRDGPFQWLQAVDDPDVAFLVTPSETFGLSYKIPRNTRQRVGTTNSDDLLVLVMVTVVRGEKPQLRPHLAGPLLFNVATRKGCQWTLDTQELAKYVDEVADETAESA